MNKRTNDEYGVKWNEITRESYTFWPLPHFFLKTNQNKLPFKKKNFTVIYLFRFLSDSASKESACKGGDPGSIPGLGRSPGEGYSNPLQYSGLEFHGQRSLVGHSSWGCKELDMTEWLKTTTFIYLVALDFNCGMLQYVESSFLKLGALYWQRGVLATGPPRKSHHSLWT